MSLLAELQRRNVFRVAALYVVGGWLILQIGDLLFDLMGLPDFALRIVLGILLLGLPVALVLAWVYELTPEGLKRDSETTRSEATASNTGRKLNIAVIVAVVLALGALGLDRLLPERGDVEKAEKGSGAISAAKNVPDPFSTSPASKSPEGGASIAVLPFADLSPEGNQRYFADGLSEELLNVLASVENLTVASRTSSFAYRDQVKNIPVIARELKVGHVLEGSVRKAGNRIRITAQLIDASADRHLWSENYDRDLTDIFAIQDEIATAIVAALRDALGIAEPAAAVTVEADTVDLGAYELYLAGREAFIARDVASRLGIPALEQAVELDPDFARAWETLSSARVVSASWLGGDLIESRAAARRAADRAIELNPALSQPYAVLANLQWDDGSVARQRVMELLDKALARDPENTTALLWRSMFLGAMGFNADARVQLERCMALDPGYQLCRRHLAYQQASAGEDAMAVANYERGIDAGFLVFEPIFVPSLVRSGKALAAKLMMAQLWGSAKVDGTGPSVASISDWVRVLEIPGLEQSDETGARIRSEATVARERTNTQVYAVTWNPLLIDTGQWDLVAPYVETFFNAWQPPRTAFRASPEFKALIRDRGIPAYWRSEGFPPRCRPLGEDDFECD